MYGYIYKTTNTLNGKVYIGLHKRSTFDVDYIGSGTRLLEALKSEGKQFFSCELIDTAVSQEELNEKEKFWIKHYNSTDPEIGYNISPGGEWAVTYWDTERRREQSERISNSYWWTDGEHEILCEQCPAGYRRGRAVKMREVLASHSSTTVGKVWISNGINEKYINESDPLPDGWHYGRIRGLRRPPSDRKYSVWVNNGQEQHQVAVTTLHDWFARGYVRGMIVKK